jgi:hypothetical protein
VFPGGGDIPVIDKSNLTVNTVTSESTSATATAAGTLVTQGQLNLTPSGIFPANPIEQLIALLNEVLATGEAVHYQLGNLPEIFAHKYPGYFGVHQDWWELLGVLSPSALDTLQGTLNTVHEQMKPAAWILDELMLGVLRGATAGAYGNLSVSQLQSMATSALIDELRKSRQLMGANINAQNVAQAHQINLQMYGEKLTHDYLEASAMDVVAYSGRTGY